ncbi:MAG: alpha/beta fold hydrolase [Betaproteobacteria bacterium]|nr:alpha/beta fold hydrolase [Betaproteobacteria bacterium]
MEGKGKGAVLLLHGLYGTPQQLQYIGRKLCVAGGYSVHIPNIQGYSVFDEPVPKETSSWTHWLDQAEAHFDLLLREHQQVSVAGLCIGANLALMLASRRSADIHALCTYSAPLRYDGWNVTRWRWLKLLGYYTPVRYFMSLAEKPPYGLKDERIRRWVATQMEKRGTSAIGSSRSPLKGVFETEKLMKVVQQNLHKIHAPSLIIHAVEDDLASPKNAEWIVRSVSSRVVRKVFLENSYHIITMDFEKERVAQETLAFIAQQSMRTDQKTRSQLRLVG